MKRIPPGARAREEFSQLPEEGTEGHPLDALPTLSVRFQGLAAQMCLRGLPMTPKIVRERDRLNSELFPEKKLAQTA